MRKYFCKCSTGSITIETKGDVSGNSQETVIVMEDAQFTDTEAQYTQSGMSLTVKGSWEIRELADALHSYVYGNSWVEDQSEESARSHTETMAINYNNTMGPF